MHSTTIHPLSNQAWRHKLVILALRRMRQEDFEFTGGKKGEMKGGKQRGRGRTSLFSTRRKWPRKLEAEKLPLWSSAL